MFLSAARAAECGEAPSRVRFALSPSWWKNVNKWLSHQYVRVQRQYSYDGDFLYGRLLCSKICVVKNRRTNRWIFNGQTKQNQQLFRAPSFYHGFDVFSLFPVVSYINEQFQNRYSSCLVEPDIELNDQ